MRLIKTFFLSFLFASLLTACDNASNEKRKSIGEKLKGNVQETVGKTTNNDQLKNEGKENKLKGDLRSTKEDIKDMVAGK